MMRTAMIVLAVVSVCVPYFVLGQQPSSLPSPQDSIGRFLGTWELHIKEGPGVPERETLTLEKTESGIKITHLVAYDKDSELHYWGVMDPKGGFVQMHQTNGKPMNEEWRIDSVDPDALTIETRPFGGKTRYQLSEDGQTMTAHILTARIASYPAPPAMVFQKTK